MAGIQVTAGTGLAQAIQSAVQPKLMENGWVSEENDTTLSEYVTMMLVNGKDLAGVRAELGNDLLGVGEEDPAVGQFAQWLFQQIQAMVAPPQDTGGQSEEVQPQQPAPVAPQDSTMDDAGPTPASAAADDAVPSGPKAMRNGTAARGKGRGGRMLGQMNVHMNREQLPDPLRRIKGAAGGQHGRIDAHAGRDTPRGPKGRGIANGAQRTMNGRGGNSQVNSLTNQQNGMMGQLDPQQQMAFMKMMEMQATMMSQFMQNGQLPGGMSQPQSGRPFLDRVDKKPNGQFKRQHQPRPMNAQNDNSGMEVDKKEPFETMCRFNLSCSNASCPYVHQSPAAPPGQMVDMGDTCAFGIACENRKCAGRHPSPAQRMQGSKQDVDCKFFPNCANPSCPFRHPTMPPCKNGADCNLPGCKFTHSKIMCRYTPCTRPGCIFKHVEGQKGVFKDKVWTPGESDNTVNRFAGLKENEAQPEELILPGQSDADSSQHNEAQANEQEMQAEVMI